MEDPLPEYGGHHNLLTHPLRHVIWENWINFSEHRIVTFSRELIFIDHCITLISYNLGNYLFQAHNSLVLSFHWWTSLFLGSSFLLKPYQLNLFSDQGKLKDYLRCLFLKTILKLNTPPPHWKVWIKKKIL